MAERNLMSYSTADYVIAAITLLVPMGIGLWYAVKDAHRATRDEYLLGNRQMSALPVSMSVFITFVSAISLMGTPAETFFFGAIAVSAHIGNSLSYIIGCFTFVPLLHPLRLTSVYEYLELRYRSEAVHLLATIIGLMSTIFYMAIVLLSPALALQACAGLPVWVSIALIGIIGTLYTAIGGFKSVVWTDVFQLTLVLVGVFAIIIKACFEVGGIGEVWRLSSEGGRTNLDKFSLDPRVRHTQLSLIVGGVFIWSTNCLSQATVQRISSLKSLREARMVFVINVFINLFYGVLIGLVGIATYAYYSKLGCDPYEAHFISNRNQIAPYFVLHAMTDMPGMIGLFMGVLGCGSLSSLSSGINAMAANTIQDILGRPLRLQKEATITLITKVLVIVYGALAIGLAYLAQSMDGPVTQLSSSVFGAFGSPILGIMILGAAVPWANKFGALAGAAVSLAINLWISLGSALQASPLKPLTPITTENCHEFSSSPFHHGLLNKTHNTEYSYTTAYDNLISVNDTKIHTPVYRDTFVLYDITYEWYPVIGCIVCITTGLVVSFLTSRIDGGCGSSVNIGLTDAKYIFPFLRKYWRLRGDGSEIDSLDQDNNETDEYTPSGKGDIQNEHIELETVSPLLLHDVPETINSRYV